MADDASVKMETLKKAYAEIILNTSKEAAARIMVADRRAFCFQRDLIALKEDALRLLIQLKQMLDSKTVEAEVTSKNQQRKIEELEDQLSEAEGIIVDLREELRLTQDKLEEVRCSQWRPLKQQTPEDFEEPPPLDDELIAKTDDERHQVQYPATENACGINIPAETTLQYADEDQYLMSAGERPSTPLQPPILSCVDKYPSTEDDYSTKNPTEGTLQHSSGDQLHRSDGEKPSTSCLPSILSLSNSSVYTIGDVKADKELCSPCSSEPDEQDVKLAPNGSQAKSQEFESHHGQSPREGFRRNRKNLKYQEAIAALRRSSHGRHAKSFQLTSLSKCRTKAVKQNKALVEEADRNGTCPTTPGSSYKSKQNHDTAQERSTKFAENSRYEEMQVDAAEKESDMSCCDPLKLDTSLADCNLHDVQISDDEESTGISNRAESDKVLKFTFQRKRRKELLTKLGSNITPEGNNAISRALSEKGDAAKLQKSIVKDEHSKDSGQLLQIAHQLISLSENGHS